MICKNVWKQKESQDDDQIRSLDFLDFNLKLLNECAKPADCEWYKVGVVGPTGSGKTSLLRQFCEQKFHIEYQPTVAVDYGFKIHSLDSSPASNSKTAPHLHFWDFSGSLNYRSIQDDLLHGVDVIILVLNLKEPPEEGGMSLRTVKQWLTYIDKLKLRPQCMAIVGNKCDLVISSGNKVEDKHAADPTLKHFLTLMKHVRYFQTSAMSSFGIKELFDYIVNECQQK